MHLAILHYHLDRGGVSKVIENHLRSLSSVLPDDAECEVAILYGGRREGWHEQIADAIRPIRLRLDVVPELEYDSLLAGRPSPRQLAGVVEAALQRQGFAADDTVLHVHNHALGKNVALPGAIQLLAQRGWAMLLQSHDFAEDFRPANFRHLREILETSDPQLSWHGWIYPQATHIHYSVLNGRDHRILRTAGVAARRLHLLPNPVPELGQLPSKDAARAKLAERFAVAPSARFVLYPVRGIRRKNVGEALLYAALAPRGTVVGLTLPPLNPDEKPCYQRWKALAEELRLPIRFELGAAGAMQFTENVAAADAILTTSLAEGFGMVFLESWLARRPLVGRDLPEITTDFIHNGLRLDSLAAAFWVPLEWVGADRFAQTVGKTYRSALSAFGLHRKVDSRKIITHKTTEGQLDFGDLDEPLQEEVIRLVSGSEKHHRRLRECNPMLEQTVFTSQADFPLDENLAAVEHHYALEPSGRRLLGLYEQVASSPREPHPKPLAEPTRILDAFLRLTRYRAIRG